MHPIDQVQLSFDSSGLMVLNVILGLIMFGVALDLSAADFRELARRPIAPAVGLVAQFFVMPALAFALSRVVAPTPSIALGMILVAACPGGNVSNFITHFARGRTTTSVGMTAVSTLAAVVMTPFNFVFWGSRAEDTAALVSDVSLDPVSMLGTIGMLLRRPGLGRDDDRRPPPPGRRVSAQAAPGRQPALLLRVRGGRVQGQRGSLHPLHRPGVSAGAAHERRGSAHRLERRPGRLPSRPGPPRGVHRGRDPELRAGSDPGL